MEFSEQKRKELATSRPRISKPSLVDGQQPCKMSDDTRKKDKDGHALVHDLEMVFEELLFVSLLVSTEQFSRKMPLFGNKF
ncbi:hypothetical protein AVEN_118266-1 [Araneus ventricosus]|uniref:Uncharacterized protein n=1 Tax=Araneus ventricosus TaxID=182803 RepID=A0A4Y2DXW3_ARAVE|nr:hypothetical protein AVEN_118266-1 [Araneus ventricosus]